MCVVSAIFSSSQKNWNIFIVQYIKKISNSNSILSPLYKIERDTKIFFHLQVVMSIRHVGSVPQSLLETNLRFLDVPLGIEDVAEIAEGLWRIHHQARLE